MLIGINQDKLIKLLELLVTLSQNQQLNPDDFAIVVQAKIYLNQLQNIPYYENVSLAKPEAKTEKIDVEKELKQHSSMETGFTFTISDPK